MEGSPRVATIPVTYPEAPVRAISDTELGVTRSDHRGSGYRKCNGRCIKSNPTYVLVGRIAAARPHRQSLNQRQANSTSATACVELAVLRRDLLVLSRPRSSSCPVEQHQHSHRSSRSFPDRGTHEPNAGLRYHNRLPLHKLPGQRFSRTSGIHVLPLILTTPLPANLIPSRCSQPISITTARSHRAWSWFISLHSNLDCFPWSRRRTPAAMARSVTFIGAKPWDKVSRRLCISSSWGAKARPACATVRSSVSHQTALHT
ncbi:hypothetical protein QBC45DRAFT_2308 [Copromyces sp. CBS 386.78]|nr:hypothetical protein QBC45DRAFT_2308 [Copromyces sp. CBS 386.78]